MASAPSYLPWLRRIVFCLFMAAMAWGYVWLSAQNIRHSLDREMTPLENRHLALTLATQRDLRPDFTHSFSEPLKKLAPHRTDGVAQPLWPWVAAWRLDEADLRGSLHDLAWFRVGLTLACLILMGLACLRYFALPAALLVVALTGFHGLLGTVSMYSGATLFHLFFLLTWLACLYALQRNSLWVYGLVGVFGALAYLSVGRIVPLVVVFILVSTLRAIWGWLAAHWCPHEGTTLWVRRNHMFGLLLLATGAGFIAGPRLTVAREQFGEATFHYSDHIRWLDDREAALAWIEAHPDKASLKRIPTLERLTPQHYFQTHTPAQIKQRLFNGMSILTGRLQGRGGEVVTILLVLLVAFTLACRFSTPKACHAGERLHPETVPTVLFLVTVAVTYGLIAAWDVTIVTANYLHALTGPLTLSLLWGCESVLRRARRRGASWMVAQGYQAVLWLLLAMTLVQFWKTAFTVP
ncbi:hypothetical protein EI77_03753 [Prosthecobacter fusiformis]|uniref:Dolichyl-phosphate-mannose-protein mannosyltransferase n=1 Tax=Prosthecobacter fusiformis TaxID=48464 RepID=A0A4R7RP60_9BACT|nr:hypothetical protein [Prosthecobacter fusiformis]TDU66017.1 hypothetical protein EI77_03753 [Prosthecobacter fusiformis]